MAPWDPNNTVHIDEVYTRLSWCREDKHPSGTEEQELGDYTDIFHGHKNYPNPKKIVVVGQGGIGKSTFSQKLAVDWAKGEKEALKKFDLLLVIKLRDVGGMRNFKEMLVASGIVQSEECAQVESFVQYINEHQERVLILFDGYDEYDRELARDVTSDVHKIITGKMLIGCHLVVTTRSQRVDEVKKYMHTQCKIKGFTQADIKKFASKYVGKEEVEPFISYLKEQDIESMAKIPLMLLFLCLLWKKRNAEPLPTSRTQLYQEFVQCILDHCHVKVSPENLKSTDECGETLCKIGKVAFEALLQDSLVFDAAQLPSEVLNDDVVRLGFLSTSKVQHHRSKMMTSFLHKSMQEFLAAWYIAKEVIPSGRTELLSSIDGFSSFRGFHDLFVFVCGLSTEGAVAVFHHLKSIGKKENLLPSGDDHISLMDLTDDQDKFLQWCFDFFLSVDCKEAILGTFLAVVNGVVLLRASLQWMILHVDLSVFPMLLHHDSFVLLLIRGCPTKEPLLHTLNQIDTKVVCSSIVYHMTASEFMQKCTSKFTRRNPKTWIWLLKKASEFFIGLQEVDIQDLIHLTTDLLQPSLASEQSESEAQASEQENNQNFVTQKLSDASENTLSFHFLLPIIKVEHSPSLFDNFFPRVSDPIMKGLLSELNCAVNLREIRVRGMEMSSELAVPLATVLDHVPCLEKLDLSNNPLGSGVSVLACHLQSVPKLRWLWLDNTDMTEREATDLANSLQHVALLEGLSLRDNPIGCGLIPLAKNLVHVPQLRSLMLEGTNMTEREATDLTNSLQHVPLLEELSLSNTPIGCGLIPLAENLVHVPQLRSLMLDNTNMTDREATDLTNSLQHVPLLEELSLSNNPIGFGLIPLAENLVHVPQLRALILDNTNMTEREATELANSLQHVPLLRKLNSRNNPIGFGLIPLAENLVHVPQLRALILDNTNMTEREATELANSLQQFPLLQELSVNDNPIGCGVIALAENLVRVRVPHLRIFGMRNTNMTEREAADLENLLHSVPPLSWV